MKYKPHLNISDFSRGFSCTSTVSIILQLPHGLNGYILFYLPTVVTWGRKVYSQMGTNDV
jgi:hypothetical protein